MKKRAVFLNRICFMTGTASITVTVTVTVSVLLLSPETAGGIRYEQCFRFLARNDLLLV